MKSPNDKIIIQNIKMLYSIGMNCGSTHCPDCALYTKRRYTTRKGILSACIFNIVADSYGLERRHDGDLSPDQFGDSLKQILSEPCINGVDCSKCKLLTDNMCFVLRLKMGFYY